MDHAIPLSRYLDHSSLSGLLGTDAPRRELRTIILAIASAAIDIADLVSLGRLTPPRIRAANRMGANLSIEFENDPGAAGRARRILADRLRSHAVRDLICAGQDETETLNEAGLYSVAIDPLDGAANVDTNMSLGTIFSISFAADATGPRCGTTQLVAGFIVYGPQTNLVLTLGAGVDVFTLDRRDRTFRLAEESVDVPASAAEYAIDASNYRHWPAAVRSLIDDHLEDASEPGGTTFNMRWMGSLVAEAYRILMRGGVFLCPPDTRRGREAGCQHLICAAHPIAFVMEQAGGRATTGHTRVLDQATARLDARTPLIFGSRDVVERIERLHALPESFAESSPLFRKRGLFRL